MKDDCLIVIGLISACPTKPWRNRVLGSAQYDRRSRLISRPISTRAVARDKRFTRDAQAVGLSFDRIPAIVSPNDAQTVDLGVCEACCRAKIGVAALKRTGTARRLASNNSHCKTECTREAYPKARRHASTGLVKRLYSRFDVPQTITHIQHQSTPAIPRTLPGSHSGCLEQRAGKSGRRKSDTLAGRQSEQPQKCHGARRAASVRATNRCTLQPQNCKRPARVQATVYSFSGRASRDRTTGFRQIRRLPPGVDE